MSVLKNTLLNWDEYVRRVGSLSDVIIEDAFDYPAITDYVTVYPNIKAKDEILYLGRLRKLLKRDAGCGDNFGDANPDSDQKFWDPMGVEARIKQCYKDLEKTFLIWTTKAGKNRPDLTNTDAAEYILTMLQEGTAEDTMRIAWFSDMDILETGSGGALRAGEDENYNQIYGLWYRIFQICAAYPKRRTTIARNAGTTYATQELQAGEGLTIIKKMIRAIDPRMKKSGNIIILATKTIVDNIQDTYDSKLLESSFSKLQNGQAVVRVLGYDVQEYILWDDIIAEDFDNGTKKDLPHRALMYAKETLAVGYDGSGPDTEFEAWYERNTKEFRAQTMFQMDTNVIKHWQIQAAY